LESIDKLRDQLKRKLRHFRSYFEGMKLSGVVEILHLRDGEVIDTRGFTNITVITGRAEVAGLINGVTSGAFTYIALGEGTTSPADANTALESEISTGGGERSSATPSRVTTDTTDDTAQLVNTFNFTAAFAVTESGVFDAASAGVMLCRQTFSVLNVISGDSLQITWKIDVD